MDADAAFSATPIVYRTHEEMENQAKSIKSDYYAEKLVAAFWTRAGTSALLSDFEAAFDAFDTALLREVRILGLGYPRANRMMDALRVAVVG